MRRWDNANIEEITPMNPSAPVKLSEYFKELTDPRIVGRTSHKLIDIIAIALCAIICGADTWPAVEAYGKAKHEWLKEFLELPNGIPTQHTFRRFFIAVSAEAFENCFLNWVRSAFKNVKSTIVPIDGKTLRRTHDNSSGKKAIHMVNAWCEENKISLGQIKTDEKSNEITAIPELIKCLELSGCIVTTDAMGCQKKISDAIIDKEADYVFGLKGNQGNLRQDVELFFEGKKEKDFKDMRCAVYSTIDGEHGRIETRNYTVCYDIDWLHGKEDWRELKSIIKVESIREKADKITKENRYYISRLDCNVETIAKAIRCHWGVKNGLHWKLDICFREDECRKRKGHSAQNFAIMRQIALNLLNQEKVIVKAGVSTKRLRAGWDNDYLLTVLNI